MCIYIYIYIYTYIYICVLRGTGVCEKNTLFT